MKNKALLLGALALLAVGGMSTAASTQDKEVVAAAAEPVAYDIDIVEWYGGAYGGFGFQSQEAFDYAFSSDFAYIRVDGAQQWSEKVGPVANGLYRFNVHVGSSLFQTTSELVLEFVNGSGETYINATYTPTPVDPDPEIPDDQITDIDVVAGNGTSTTSIEGAGAFIWLNSADMGMTDANFNSASIKATITKNLDANGNQLNWSVSYAIFQNYGNGYICAYVVLSGAPAADYETTIQLLITLDSVNYYRANAEFIGLKWANAEPDPEIPEDQIKHIPVAESNGSALTRIQGTGAFIWLNASDIEGLDASNWSTASVIGKMEESLNPGGVDTGWAVTSAHLEQFGNGFICAYAVINAAPVEGFSTTISVTITLNGSYYRATATFDGVNFVAPATDAAQGFIDDWAAMRLEGGESGICAFINTATMNDLLARYDALSNADKAVVDTTADGENCTIGDSIIYVKTLTTESTESNSGLTVNAEGQSLNISLIVIIAVCALSAVGAYTYISKKHC